METNQVYPWDVTNAQYGLLAPLVPPPKPGGCPRRLESRRVVNAIFSVDRSGCQWRYLPKDYPNWTTVYWSFTRRQDGGTWERLNDALRPQLRPTMSGDPDPGAGIMDSQPVKTMQLGAVAATTRTRK